MRFPSFRKERPNAWLDKTVQEVPIERVPGKVNYEIMREKGDRKVAVKKGKISPKREWVQIRMEGTRRRFYPNHILKETIAGKARYFVRWNLYYAEALDPSHPNIPERDQALEQVMRNSRKEQLLKAVASVGGLNIDRTVITLLLLAMVFGIPIGLSYNDIFNWVPRTVIHWVPRA